MVLLLGFWCLKGVGVRGLGSGLGLWAGLYHMLVSRLAKVGCFEYHWVISCLRLPGLPRYAGYVYCTPGQPEAGTRLCIVRTVPLPPPPPEASCPVPSVRVPACVYVHNDAEGRDGVHFSTGDHRGPSSIPPSGRADASD